MISRISHSSMLRGARDPLLDCFLDFEDYQDSTIAKFHLFGNNGRSRLFWDPENSKLFKHIPYVFKNICDLVGCAYVLRVPDCIFRISEIHQDSTSVKFHLL